MEQVCTGVYYFSGPVFVMANGNFSLCFLPPKAPNPLFPGLRSAPLGSASMLRFVRVHEESLLQSSTWGAQPQPSHPQHR